MADVFISYHVVSAGALVKTIATELQKQKITCWYSEENVRAGEDFTRQVVPEIKKCRIFLLILDHGAAESGHVQNELGIAFKRKRQIVILPFVTQSCSNEWIEYYLTHTQRIDATNKSLSTSVEELVARIQEILKKADPKSLSTEEVGVTIEETATTQESADVSSHEPPNSGKKTALLMTAVLVVLFLSLCLWTLRLAAQTRSQLPESGSWPESQQDNSADQYGQESALSGDDKGDDGGSALSDNGDETAERLDNQAGGTESASATTDGARAESVFPLVSRTVQETISAGGFHTVVLHTDGTVSAVGRNIEDQCNTSTWNHVAAVSAGDFCTLCLTESGNVSAKGETGTSIGLPDVFGIFRDSEAIDWSGMIEISAGGEHTAGLCSDGTVLAAGNNFFGQCNVGGWKNIISVSAGQLHTVGLCADGTVVAAGSNSDGQCNVSDWTKIVAVSSGGRHTVALREDGTVLAIGSNDKGQCEVFDWSGIVAISAGESFTVGLKEDGTVVAVGRNDSGQCEVFDWRNIVAISAGGYHTVGLCADGSAVAVGRNEDGQCNVSAWTDIQIPSQGSEE